VRRNRGKTGDTMRVSSPAGEAALLARLRWARSSLFRPIRSVSRRSGPVRRPEARGRWAAGRAPRYPIVLTREGSCQ